MTAWIMVCERCLSVAVICTKIVSMVCITALCAFVSHFHTLCNNSRQISCHNYKHCVTAPHIYSFVITTYSVSQLHTHWCHNSIHCVTTPYTIVSQLHTLCHNTIHISVVTPDTVSQLHTWCHNSIHCVTTPHTIVSQLHTQLCHNAIHICVVPPNTVTTPYAVSQLHTHLCCNYIHCVMIPHAVSQLHTLCHNST